MIPRYSTPEMSAIFSDVARFGRYLEIELLATEGQASVGVVPDEAVQACRNRAPVVDEAFVEAVSERERITDHDVAAFVDVVQGAIGGPDGTWIHYGLTSADVVDTAWAWMLRDAAGLLIEATSELIATLRELAWRHRDTVMIGRTHGIHAEPTTFGVKVALWCLQVCRDRDRLRRAHETIGVCKLSGAVGTYSNIDPERRSPRWIVAGSDTGARDPSDCPRPSRRVPLGLRLVGNHDGIYGGRAQTLATNRGPRG